MGTFSGSIIVFAAAYLEASGAELSPVIFLTIGLATIVLIPDKPLFKVEINNQHITEKDKG